jgi:predicted GH43/DUF377 family glycosyl hydrolase
VVFANAAVEIGSEIWLYYGAADTCIAAAKISAEALLAELAKYPL